MQVNPHDSRSDRFVVADHNQRSTLGVRDLRLRRSIVMRAHHEISCFIFDAELIELLHQSADELCVAIERSFANRSDLEDAKFTIVKAVVDCALEGERDASNLKSSVMATLQDIYPALSLSEAVALALTMH